MQCYSEMMKYILKNGTRKETRGVLQSTGTNIDAISIFGYMLQMDLKNGFPLLTTKKLNFNAIKHELNWFLRGSTNIRYLKDHNVNIWNQWADSDGELGPIYGKQWRNFDGIDQIWQVIMDIRKVIENPNASCGRRLIVSAWNPAELYKMTLPPCHLLFQFNVTKSKLNCVMYQRSADAFLGVPYNIASYSLLIHIFAKWTGLTPGTFTHMFGDLHIYMNHIDQVQEQLTREPKPLCNLVIGDNYKFETLNINNAEDIQLTDYNFWPALKGEVAI